MSESEEKSFNQKFEENQQQKKLIMQQRMHDKLNALNNSDEKILLHELSIGDILINTKDSSFELLDDLLQFKYNKETFTKNNRLFYLGVFLIIISMFIFLYNTFVDDNDSCNSNK